MGFQPQDTGTIEQRFGFLKLNLTYKPVFARAYTVKRCLLLISVWIVCLLTLKSKFFASGFRHHQIMRVIYNDAHSKTPVEFLYLESATLPLKYILASRRIMYLHNILSKDKEELVKRVYEVQKNNPTPGDFICLVKEDLKIIGEPFDEDRIVSMNKLQIKTHIKKKT